MAVVITLILALVTPAASALRSMQGELVLTREADPLYHWPGCPLVRDTSDLLAMTRGQAAGRGKKPHADCDPQKVTETPDERKDARALATPVFIVQGDRYYHREKCEKRGASAQKVTLEHAAKKHFPCRTCKPPVRPRPDREPLTRQHSS